MAVRPKNLVKNIKDAQKRVEAQKIKVRVNKPSATPVLKTNPKPSKKRRYEDGLSIDEMLRETPARVKAAMEKDNVSIQTMRKSNSGATLLCQTVSYKKNGESTYKQVIENLDDETEKFSNSKWIKVSCECAAFKYWSDWVLHQKGSSDLDFSTDEAPNITNPQGLTMVCKHLLKEFIAIKQRGI